MKFQSMHKILNRDMGTIYRIYNRKTGKSYIGSTISPLVSRLNQHYLGKPWLRRDLKHCVFQILQRVRMNKNENSMLYSCELRILESKYIKKFNSCKPNGYNGTR